jgi:hypothetical protein
MGVLKVILIVIASFYVLGWLGRLWLRSYMKKMQKRMEDLHQQRQGGGYQQKKEGEIKVEIKNKQGKKFTKDQGDYVDYEEIKD